MGTTFPRTGRLVDKPLNLKPMIDVFSALKSRFSKVCVLTMSDRKDRFDGIMDQLHRIGMTNKDDVYVQYATPFPHNALVANAFNASGRGRFTKANEYDCSRNHYAMVRIAYDQGYDNVLILEDDIRFLKDGGLFIEYIDNLPKDFDVVQFGGFSADPKILQGGYWYTPTVGLWNASMYGLSRNGMRYYLDFMDRFFWVADGPLYNLGKSKNDLKYYIPSKPLSIQADKEIVKSDIRDKQNDKIDYNTMNVYESKITKDEYL